METSTIYKETKSWGSGSTEPASCKLAKPDYALHPMAHRIIRARYNFITKVKSAWGHGGWARQPVRRSPRVPYCPLPFAQYGSGIEYPFRWRVWDSRRLEPYPPNPCRPSFRKPRFRRFYNPGARVPVRFYWTRPNSVVPTRGCASPPWTRPVRSKSNDSTNPLRLRETKQPST